MPIEKPKILSDEKLREVADSVALVGNLPGAIAQAQNDYCYKEMLGQFRIKLEEKYKVNRNTPANVNLLKELFDFIKPFKG